MKQLIKWIRKWVVFILNIPFGYPHELCHYLVARLVGYKATMSGSSTVIVYIESKNYRIKNFCIAIAPAVFIVVLYALYVSYFGFDYFSWTDRIPAIITISWLAGCISDFEYCLNLITKVED